MKRYIDSLTVTYALLCLSGIIILCIGLSTGFHVYINSLLTIVGGVLTVAGGVFLIDKLISHRVKKRVSLRWKAYSEIAGFLKWVMLEMLIGGFAIGYWAIALYIVRVASQPR